MKEPQTPRSALGMISDQILHGDKIKPKTTDEQSDSITINLADIRPTFKEDLLITLNKELARTEWDRGDRWEKKVKGLIAKLEGLDV